jgi:hypothetical protein
MLDAGYAKINAVGYPPLRRSRSSTGEKEIETNCSNS